MENLEDRTLQDPNDEEIHLNEIPEADAIEVLKIIKERLNAMRESYDGIFFRGSMCLLGYDSYTNKVEPKMVFHSRMRSIILQKYRKQSNVLFIHQVEDLRMLVYNIEGWWVCNSGGTCECKGPHLESRITGAGDYTKIEVYICSIERRFTAPR